MDRFLKHLDPRRSAVRSGAHFWRPCSRFPRIFSHMSEKSRALRVLIVEDELLIRWSIAETLEGSGHAVVQAEDAATAMQRLTDSSSGFDVVLLDYRLPDSNDLQLLDNVRRTSPRSVVILMTAFVTPEVVKGALDLGAYRVMSKPFEVHDLEELILEASNSGTSG
jgi:DNA-binding NtrC family response regulator